MLFASGASIDITPDLGTPLVGYAAAKRPADAIFSRLEANIILMACGPQPVAIVGIDTLFAGADFIASVKSYLGDVGLQLLFVATHSHFAPSLDGLKPSLGPLDTHYFNRVARSVAGKLSDLLSGSKYNAILSYGTSNCRANIYRRRRATRSKKNWPFIEWTTVAAPNRKVEIPESLQLIAIEDLSRNPQAILWSWPCHAVDGHEPRSISSCFPGYVRRWLRIALGRDIPVVYFPGLSGDLRPRVALRRPGIAGMARHPFMLIERFGPFSELDVCDFGETVSRSAVSALRNVKQIESSATKYESESIRLSDVSSNRKGSFDISVLKIGDLEIVGFGAEVCHPYYDSFGADPEKSRIYSGCVGATFGYLPSAAQIPYGGYEVIGSLHPFSLSGPVNVNAENIVRKTTESLIKEAQQGI